VSQPAPTLLKVEPTPGEVCFVRRMGMRDGKYVRSEVAVSDLAPMQPNIEPVYEDGEFIGNRVVGMGDKPAFSNDKGDGTWVAYLGRMALVRIRPAWEHRWHKHAQWIEVTPQPKEGDYIAPRNSDNSNGSEVWMVLFSAASVGTRFDSYHYVVAKQGGKFTRTWVRWSYSGQNFVPVQDTGKLAGLNGGLPR